MRLYKFFMALPDDRQVCIFALEDLSDPKTMPSSSPFRCCASILLGDHNLDAELPYGWNAYTQDDGWVGTSEF